MMITRAPPSPACLGWRTRSFKSGRKNRNDKGAYDIGLVTALPLRESSAIERAIQGDEERRQAFEPGEEGVVPRIRVRRLPTDLENDERVHLALVVGDEVPAFRPELRTEPGKPGSADDLWNPRVFFEETRPELFEASIAVGDRDDSLSRNVARAVGFAMDQHGGLVFRETYTFDRDRCKKPLGKIQSGAHWLVLASRQPLYRAVQKAGPDVTALLDFYSTIERGRTVHVCASLNAHYASDDLRRLDAAVTALFGPDPAGWGAQALVAAATRFAPGLAMRCAGAVSAAHVEGLIGLLLTGHEARRANPGAIVLSLDQHEHLLVPGGQLGDILIVKSRGGVLFQETLLSCAILGCFQMCLLQLRQAGCRRCSGLAAITYRERPGQKRSYAASASNKRLAAEAKVIKGGQVPKSS